jgi:hypothetical protein
MIVRLWTADVRATKGQASPWKGRVQDSMSSACGSHSHTIMQLSFSAAVVEASAAAASALLCEAACQASPRRTRTSLVCCRWVDRTR